MQLSLAATQSILALAQAAAILCISPARLPRAGAVTLCCFDKTGTLTDDHAALQGIAGLPDGAVQESFVATEDRRSLVLPVTLLPTDSPSRLVMATCHGLVKLPSGSIVGDPMETLAFMASGASLLDDTVTFSRRSSDDASTTQSNNISARWQILKRHAFCPILRRMSVIIRGEDKESFKQENVKVAYKMATKGQGFSSQGAFVVTKGAPEAILPLLKDAPTWYSETAAQLADKGARLLALAYKSISYTQDGIHVSRLQLEMDLCFAGFLVYSCPLKRDAHYTINALLQSAHEVVMVTGDHPRTAIHIATELAILPPLHVKDNGKPNSSSTLSWVLLDYTDSDGLVLRTPESVDSHLSIADPNLLNHLAPFSYISLTGAAMDALSHEAFYSLLPRLRVAARFSPKQKASLLAAFKSLGHTTLMCGDG
jgi:manganese-transporting P-type ATPase